MTKNCFPFTNGNYYEVTVKMSPLYPITLSKATSLYVGSVITTDGNVYAKVSDATKAEKTACAIIAYVGSAGSVDDSSDSYRGLAIALSDASGSSKWSNTSTTCLSWQSNSIGTAITYLDGITSTTTLISHISSHTHEAAATAVSNGGNAAPTTGTSGWFLPSIGQWNLIVKGLATKAGATETPDLVMANGTATTSTYLSSNLNDVITAATGGTGGFQAKNYRSSSEYNKGSAWNMSFGLGRANFGTKTTTNNLYVRSVLAF